MKAVLDHVLTRPLERQEEVAEIILVIERSEAYHTTLDELQALDKAELSGIANEAEVEAAFRSFSTCIPA